MSDRRGRAPELRLAGVSDIRRAAPTILAGSLALVYVLLAPPSLDLAAHLFRAQLFRQEGFAIWDNWWYSGHHILGYSVLFPPVSAWLSPQLAAAIAATGTAAVFESLAYRHLGRDAFLGTLLFGAATAVDLFTGRLAFAFGALPAMAAVAALDRGSTWTASGLALLAALSSPVAALFTALAGVAYALGGYLSMRRHVPLGGLVVAAAALAPIAVIAVLFPEGGTEPFAFTTLWPIPLAALFLVAVVPPDWRQLRVGIVLYAVGTIAAFLASTQVGSNAARLGTLIAAPLAALALAGRRRNLFLVLALLPLLYLEWHDPVRDLTTAADDPSAASGYYQPLLDFLRAQRGPPFRVEIPFTRFHWEAYVVARRYPIARGWERQLDINDNPIFYRSHLTAAIYEAWLHHNAVRFVALADAPLDYSARAEAALVDGGLPYLRLLMRSTHWRVYEVLGATPIVQGAATLEGIGPDWLTLQATRPGSALVHVHFTPYWALTKGSGCVAPAGDLTELTLRAPGPVRLGISFSLSRIGSRSPRCS